MADTRAGPEGPGCDLGFPTGDELGSGARSWLRWLAPRSGVPAPLAVRTLAPPALLRACCEAGMGVIRCEGGLEMVAGRLAELVAG